MSQKAGEKGGLGILEFCGKEMISLWSVGKLYRIKSQKCALGSQPLLLWPASVAGPKCNRQRLCQSASTLRSACPMRFWDFSRGKLGSPWVLLFESQRTSRSPSLLEDQLQMSLNQDTQHLEEILGETFCTKADYCSLDAGSQIWQSGNR